MKRKLFVLYFLNSIPFIVFAQNATVKQIGFTTGLTYNAIKSDAYSPRILSGVGVPLELFFQRIKDNIRYSISTGFLSSNPSEASNTSIKNVSGHISFEYFKKAKNWDKISFFYGVSAIFIGSNRQLIVPNLGNNNQSYELATTLDAAIMAEYFDGKNRLTSQLNYALLGYQTGTLYSYAYYDDRILSPANVVQLTGSIRLLTPISKHFNFRTGYLFYLYRSPTPQYLGILKHQMELALCYQF